MKADERSIKQAAEALKLDVPVMAGKVVDGRLELSLYGGRVVVWPDLTRPAVDPRLMAAPERYDRAQLRRAAVVLGIEGAARMNKIPLVKAIRAWQEQRL